jgi:hypothetical protein
MSLDKVAYNIPVINSNTPPAMHPVTSLFSVKQLRSVTKACLTPTRITNGLPAIYAKHLWMPSRLRATYSPAQSAVWLCSCISGEICIVPDTMMLLCLSSMKLFVLKMVVWEPSMGYSHRLPNRYRGNAYANRYPSNSQLPRDMDKLACTVASSVFTWVRLKAVNETCGSVPWKAPTLVFNVVI